MRDGECWELPMSARPIGASASGLWPTPHGFSKDGKSNGPSGNELGRAVNLATPTAQGMWPTPTRRDHKGGADWSKRTRNGKPRKESDQTLPDMVEQSGGSLNPTWVEWLMGWPLGWTDLGASATAKSHSAPQKHSDS
jgi:hypothetical protein